MDARVDITYVFAFKSPADPTRSVLAMNVNPLAPTLADSFAPEALYELLIYLQAPWRGPTSPVPSACRRVCMGRTRRRGCC